VTPTILFYGLADAVAALQAAASLRTPVRLKSPFAVTASLGPQLATSIIEQASGAVPEAEADWVLDCEDEPGLALAALRTGVINVRVALSEQVYACLADIAAQLGRRISRTCEGALTLDLADIDDPGATCRQWLQRLGNGPNCSRMPDCQC
jgi:hypothetical protein